MAFNLKAGIQNVRSNVETLLKGKANPIHVPAIENIAKKLAIPFEQARQMHAVDVASTIAKTATNVAKAAVEAIQPKTAYADYGGMTDLMGTPATRTQYEKDKSYSIVADNQGHTTFVPASAADKAAGRATDYGGKIFSTPSGYKYTVIGNVAPSDAAINGRLSKTAIIVPHYITANTQEWVDLGTKPQMVGSIPYPVSVLNKKVGAAANRDIINKEVIRHFSAQPEAAGVKSFSFEGGSYDPGTFSDTNYYGDNRDNPITPDKWMPVN